MLLDSQLSSCRDSSPGSVHFSHVAPVGKGFLGRAFQDRLAADGTSLLTRTADNIDREGALDSARLVIESVFSNLNRPIRLEQHPTAAGLATRIAQRIPALTLGMLLNTFIGRPAHALAAYDGR